jgi:hypothetical protein
MLSLLRVKQSAFEIPAGVQVVKFLLFDQQASGKGH